MLTKKFVPAWQKGFTLIELLVVIGIIGILVAVVLVAVNPSRQFASARDTQRRSDLYAITNAIYQYAAENNGDLPNSTSTPLMVNDISTTPTVIGTNTGAGAINLGAALMPDYLPAVPKDPDPACTDATTCYYVNLDVNGRVVATAASELRPGVVITITR